MTPLMNHRVSTAVLTLTVSLATITSAAIAQSRRPLNALLQELHAQDWTARAAAVDQLADNPGMWRAPATKRALIQLLDRENKSMRAPRQPSSQSSDHDIAEHDDDGEAYAEYYSTLLGHVERLVDPRDVHSVAILVQSAYNPDSDFAIRLASYGQKVVPALLEINANPDPHRRADSYELLGQVLRHQRLGTNRFPLTTQTVRDFESRLREGLRDSNPSVRMEAIQGVRLAGDVASLPMLQQLSTSDPWVLPGTTNHFIRKLAAEAITAIQAHPLSK
jgi:hypothetical protein